MRIEDGLGLVGELLDAGEAEEAAPALDRMGGPEDLVHQHLVDVGPLLLDGEQARLDLSEVLVRLLDEALQDLVIHVPPREAARRRRAGG